MCSFGPWKVGDRKFQASRRVSVTIEEGSVVALIGCAASKWPLDGQNFTLGGFDDNSPRTPPTSPQRIDTPDVDFAARPRMHEPST